MLEVNNVSAHVPRHVTEVIYPMVLRASSGANKSDEVEIHEGHIYIHTYTDIHFYILICRRKDR